MEMIMEMSMECPELEKLFKKKNNLKKTNSLTPCQATYLTIPTLFI